MTPFAIAGVQMYVNALQSNVDGMIQRLDILMARFPWTQMVLFSELSPFGPLDQFTLPPENETLERFQEAARKHKVWLIPGSMFLKDPEDGRVYNTAVVINPEGEIIRRYAKMFPFRPYEAIIDDVVYDSAAANAGLDWDQEVLRVLKPVPQPSKYWMFIPALLLLALVVFLQRGRSATAPRQKPKTA